MEENKFKNVKEKIAAFLKDKGLYVVLMVCIAMVGIAVALAYGPAGEDTSEAQVQQTPQQSPEAESVSHSEGETLQEATAKDKEPDVTPSPSMTPLPEITAQATPKASKTPTREKASAPVRGAVQWGYAVNELIYSKTLNQWMTHAGVDIASAKGTEVQTVWNGTVDQIYTDDCLGVTVVILHRNGLKTVYANLKEEPPVKEGRKVNAGDVIGCVGDTAIAECGEGAHLHFEVYKDEAVQNPLDYIFIIED